jgi:hypothetical protein
MDLTFTPRIETLGFLPEFDQHTLKNEPMLFNCDEAHARKLGGPITRALLDALPADWHDAPLVVDTKVAMLMPGWFPCIPGWHHDDVERRGPHGQPDYIGKSKRAEFVMALVGAAHSATEFLNGPVLLPLPPEGETIYADWDRRIGFMVADDQVSTTKADDREVLFFDDATFHRGTVCREGGWRYFGRVSRYYDLATDAPIARGNERTNEVRNQVQIYMSAENAGW